MLKSIYTLQFQTGVTPMRFQCANDAKALRRTDGPDMKLYRRPMPHHFSTSVASQRLGRSRLRKMGRDFC